ncbi:hypothetical protein C7999DRAFT_10940 [Corynascus novoguineensis]|uniref:F-box domain-containing protein n=1 Tax=Corynascus novoguineensis TaxID=1126955 RepID=A0AAN7D1S8_9PEZI|nr:hypothetical protein C7999DRAFT_10940 [Corynascus novoguineensis]
MQLKRPARLTTLCSLSNELILLILSNFCLHCRQGPHETPQVYFPATGQRRDEPSWYALDMAALHSMSLVSRRFSPLAQEILYHEFIPGYGDSWYDFDWCPQRFLRAVARNPDRAASVKRLYIDVNLLAGIDKDSVEAVLQDASQVRGIDASAFVVTRDDDFLSSDTVAQLIRNKEALQTLHLDISSRPQTPGRNRKSPTELFASLNSFPVLRNLLLSSILLYHDAGDSVAEDASVLTRLLPRSIVLLQVMVADNIDTQGMLSRLATGFVHLAQAVSQGQFRNLKSVSCNTEQRLDGYNLDAMFAIAGIDFGYDAWQFNDKMLGRRSGFRLGSPAHSITSISSDDETDS